MHSIPTNCFLHFLSAKLHRVGAFGSVPPAARTVLDEWKEKNTGINGNLSLEESSG